MFDLEVEQRTKTATLRRIKHQVVLFLLFVVSADWSPPMAIIRMLLW